MATLAKTSEVTWPIVCRVVIEVRGCKNDARVPDAGCLFEVSASLQAYRCQRRRENGPAGRSKIASQPDGRAAAEARHSFNQRHPELSFSVGSKEPAFRPTWQPGGHGAQRRGWEEQSHAQHREHGERRTFPAASTVAALPVGFFYVWRWRCLLCLRR